MGNWFVAQLPMHAPPRFEKLTRRHGRHNISGQDQMRVVKQRLLELIPELHVFLDVDGECCP